MIKIVPIFLVTLLSFGVFFNTRPISTTAAVVIAGAHIKARDIPINHKYNRKDCPVCKGKGWYISGDDITKVNCGYCEEKPNTEQ